MAKIRFFEFSAKNDFCSLAGMPRINSKTQVLNFCYLQAKPFE